MDAQEIRAQIESYDSLPSVAATERFEDSEHFIGKLYGETVRSVSPIALALEKACCGEEHGSCGTGCDSNCGCC